MSDIPPAYPRVPYLRAPEDLPSAWVVPDPDSWLEREVRVEEKLDGANVAIWLEAGHPVVAGRAGPGALDRAHQLGRLRAWSAEHLNALTCVLGDGGAAYGEWLWLQHSIFYDSLPDYLVLLDLWNNVEGFLDVDERDQRAAAVGFSTPPVLFEGVLGSWAALNRVMGRSRFGSQQAEGVVLRDRDGGHRCKLVWPGFKQVDDLAWRAGRDHNRLAAHD